jgi:tripartite-type tricarboxylate transporter receptor subunit TctC
MILSRRRFLHLASAAAATAAVAPVARAQAYPSRPITIIEPFAAGGPIDTIGRIIAERMRVSLGQPLIVENVAGASGTLALARVARAAPDGYTIGHGSTPTHVFNGAVFKLPFDIEDDFQPISPIGSAPLLIVARKSIAAHDLMEFIAWLKANPYRATQGTGGVAATSHIAGIFLQQVSGTRFTLVPYRGAGPAMQDLIAGQIDMMIDPAANTLPQVRADRVKALAVTANRRLAGAPDIPTVDEAGLPGFHVENWQGFFAPRGTPADVVERLNAAVVDALADPAVRARLVDLGQEIFPPAQQTPAALAALHRAGIEKWWPIIKAAGIKPE